MKLLFEKINNSQFYHKISHALSGTLIAQFLSVLLSPILSRIYDPKIFGVYAAFISTGMIVYVVSSLAMDHAISTSHDETESIDLFKIAISLGFVANFFLLFIFYYIRDSVSLLFGITFVNYIPMLIPVYAFLMTCYMSIYFIYIRFGLIKYSARLKILMASSVLFFDIVIFFANVGYYSLIFAQILGYFITIAAQIKPLIKIFNRYNSKDNSIQSVRGIKYYIKLIKRKKEFVYKYMPGNLLSTITIQLPSILLTSMFGAAISGFYSLTNRVLNAPVSAISTAVGDVYRNEAYNEYKTKGNFRATFIKTLKLLTAIGILLFLFLSLGSATLFKVIFGEKWSASGSIALYMMPFYLSRFISIPISFSLIILKKMNLNLYIQAIFLVLTILSFAFGKYIANDWITALVLYSISGTFVFLMYIYLTNKYTTR